MNDKNKPSAPDITSKTDANRDPITGTPGAHPVGTGLGAAGGGMAGAAIGALGGPVGAAAGATIGAVAGGLAGKGVAEKVDPTIEEKYWRSNFSSAPYVKKDLAFDDYAPAYKLGWERAATSAGRSFDEVQSDLGRDWDKVKGKSRLTWDSAKDATRAAWQRTSDTVERLTPGDSDHDGK
jgi:phage tail tape-measure protein